MTQQGKDLALSLLYLRFHPWPRNFTCCSHSQKKKKNQRDLFCLS